MGLSGGRSFDTAAIRNSGVLHRNGITAVDKLAVPGTLTLAAITESGSTLPASALNVAASAFNRWGPSGPSAIATITPALNQAVRTTIPQVSGADGYDIFISVDAAPKWVGRITEAQRASGGFIISAVGTVTAGGGAGAGQVDLGIVGTGVASNAAPFAFNSAYTPASPTAINCAGYSRAHLHIKLAVTDLRSAPALTILPFFQDQTSSADWFNGLAQTLSLLGGAGQSLEQDFEIDIDGATGLVVLIDTITGQGSAMSCWVELA